MPRTVFVHDTIFRKVAARSMRFHRRAQSRERRGRVSRRRRYDRHVTWLTIRTARRSCIPNSSFRRTSRVDYHWGEKSGFVITSQMTPLDDRSCRVYTLISYRFPLPRLLVRCLRPLLHAYTRTVLEQDIRIMRANRRGLDNAPAPQQRNVKADLVHVRIERLIDAVRDGVPLSPDELGRQPIDFHL